MRIARTGGLALLLFGGLLFLFESPQPVVGQAKKEEMKKEEPKTAPTPDNAEEVILQTCDGLRLSGLWYAGKKGRQSDVVILCHNYGPKFSSSKGEWGNLARKLQEADYAVLTFDFRGHGRSTTTRTIFDARSFLDKNKYPYNRYANVGTNNPLALKEINAAKFSGNYYPYLINDLAAARRFIDERNDAGQCNSGAIYLIGDRHICDLVMMFIGTEYTRNGINAAMVGGLDPKHCAGTDYMGAVFLSYDQVNTMARPLKALMDDRMLWDERVFIKEPVREKVGFLFVQSEEDTTAKRAAGYWFSQWGIREKEDRDRGKYMNEVKQAKSLKGIELLDSTKGLGVDKPIIEFLKSTSKKNINGNSWKQRNANIYDIQPVPMRNYGL